MGAHTSGRRRQSNMNFKWPLITAIVRRATLLGVMGAMWGGGGDGERNSGAVVMAYRGTVPIFPDVAENSRKAASKAMKARCNERQKVFAPEAVIEAKGLTKIFRNHHVFFPDEEVIALNNITAQLKGPKAIALVGHREGGKTTFLKTLAGLEEPTAGEITISGQRKAVYLGRDVSSMTGKSVRRLLRERVKENLPGQNRGHVEIVTDTILGAMDLHKQSRTQDRDLSGGEVYRFAIALALAKGCSSPTPPVLLLDGVFDKTDERVRRGVQWTLFDLMKEYGVMLLFTAHNYQVVMELAKQVAVFCNGRITEVSTHERSQYGKAIFEQLRMQLEYESKRRRQQSETASFF